MPKRTSAVKDSGLAWLGEIPAEWSVKRVKDIADLRSGEFIDAVEIAAEGAYPVFGGNGVRGYTSSFTHDGDFALIGRQGALCGNINYATGRFWATEHAVVATLRDGFDVKWFGELLRAMNLNQYSNAAAQPGLAVDRIKLLRLPVPPKSEQRLIGGYLDARCKIIDTAVAVKQLQIRELNRYGATIVETAVTGGLDSHADTQRLGLDWIARLPTHWKAVRIKRLLTRMDYGISEATGSDGRFSVLKMGNIQDGQIHFTNMEFVEEVEEALLLEKHDILYNRTNSSDQVGKAALFLGSKSDAVTFASYLVRLRTNHRVLPEFLNHVLNTQGFLSFARKLAIPSVQQSNLNSTRYGRMFVPLPPLHEQEDICIYLQAELSKLGACVESIESQVDTLLDYRQSMIHEFVTGQQRVSAQSPGRWSHG